MSGENEMDKKMAAVKAEFAAGRQTTAYNASDFLGNLGIHVGFLDNESPENIALTVQKCVRDHIPMFERNPRSGEFLVADAKLKPLKGMRETYGITLGDIERLYLAAQEPLNLEKLRPLLTPLIEGVKRFKQNN